MKRDLIVAKYRNGETKDIKLGFEATKKMRLYDIENQVPEMEEIRF